MAVEITPDGAFPELFSEYIEYKRNLGYVYPQSRLYLVRRLSRFLAGRDTDERVLTRAAAEAFVRPCNGESSGSAAGRRGIARQFALFLRWKGIQAWVLPERSQPRQSRSFAPRIITAEEMARVIACADARPESRCGPQTQPVYAMLVRLLWCCGLRIGEALSLRVRNLSSQMRHLRSVCCELILRLVDPVLGGHGRWPWSSAEPFGVGVVGRGQGGLPGLVDRAGGAEVHRGGRVPRYA
jgi:integrase/recombinase XerD